MKRTLTMLFTTAMLAVLLTFPAKVNAQFGCPTPTGMSTTNIDLFSAELDWNNSIFASNSLLEIRPVGTNFWIPIIVQQTPFTAPALLCGTDYEWRVSAICQLGPIILPSDPSAVQTFTTLGCNNLCPSPTALTTNNIGENSAELSWTPAFTFLTDYNLRYREVGTSTWVDVNNVTTPYNLSGLICGVNYEWEVQTLCPNPFGNPIPGAWSGVTSFTTLSCPPCVTPGGLSANNVSFFGASLSWNSAPAPASSYQLRYRVTGTTAWTLISNAVSPYQLNVLTCNTAYQWQVRTVCPPISGNAPEYSPWTTTNTFSTLACPSGCPPPTGLTASGISMQSASLSWVAQAPAPVSYQMRFRELGSTAWTLINNAVSPVTVDNLNCKATYEWQVRSACGATTVTYSSWTNITTFTTLNCDAFCPGPVNLATANITLSSAIFSWNVQAPLPVTSQLRYRVVGTSAWTFVSNAASPYQAANLTCGADYEWQVRTNCNGIGTLTYSPWSPKVNFTTLNCAASCPVPGALAASNIALYSASVNWSLITPAPVGFDIRYRLAGSASWTQVDNVTSPYSITALTCSSNYEWEVRTVCGNSVSNDPYSAWSATQSFSTLACTFACPAPAGLAASSITDQGAVISWAATAPGSVTYQYRYRVNGTTAWTPVINNAASSPVQLANLTCGTPYQWQVRTVCGTPGNISYSAWSGLSSFSTLSCPFSIYPEGTETTESRIQTADMKISVYPNPANSSVNISWTSDETSKVIYELRDVLGKVVYSGTVVAVSGWNEVAIETASLRAGWYAVTIHSASGSTTQKLMIQH